MNTRQQLEAAIIALEAQRNLVGDAVTDAAMAPIRDRLAGIVEHEQSLRQVTVLFSDVVGSTALSRRLDPEDIHAIIDGALRRLTDVVHVHEGQVLQYAGDSLLAVFGAPRAREDDPERAVHCGLAIAREAQQIGAEVRATSQGGDFNVRVGIHTGSVLLGGGIDDASTIRGIAVNIAARMEQTAPVGGVRISHETHRHVRGKFEVTDEPPITVKGFAEPMRSHLVLRATPRSFALVSRGIEGIAARMVGRDADLARLTEAYETARDERRLQIVTVVGDPGIGKSRLMLEFEQCLKRDKAALLFLHARAQPYSNSVPYGLLRDLLLWHFEIFDSDSQDCAQAKLAQGFSARLGDRGPQLAALVGRLVGFDYRVSADITGIEGNGREVRDRAFHAMLQYLRALHDGVSAPVALLLDDLHWADDGSLDFIRFLSRACTDSPLLLLGLTRPGLFERRPLWCSGQDNHLRIDLGPLSKRNGRELVEALLARLDLVPDALRELIISSAEGNPYYTEELIGMLMDDGVIVVNGDHWQVVADRLLQVRVPSTLAGVLQARLDALPAQELATLQHASVIGHVFWDEALQRMAPVAPQALESLIRRDLARGRETSMFEGTREYVFKHHLLRRVTYDSVLKHAKREQHRSTAEWLVTRSGERSPEFEGLIADHFEKAGDAANAVGHLRKAAINAWKAYALTASLTFYDRALALMPESFERFYTLLSRAIVAFGINDRDMWRRNVEQLEQLAEQLNDEGLRAHASSFRTVFAARTYDLSTADRSAAKALESARDSGNTPAAIRAHNQLSFALCAAGQLEAAQLQAQHGLALARSTNDYAGEASALEICGTIALELGDLSAARRHYQAAVDLLKMDDDLVWKTWMSCYVARTELRIGNYLKATQLLDSAMDTFRALRHYDGQAAVAIDLGDSAYRCGELSEAMTWLDFAHGIESTCSNDEIQAVLLNLRGEVLEAMGSTQEAKACYEKSIETLSKLNRPRGVLDCHAGLARLALCASELSEARSLISVAIDQIDAGWRAGLADDALRVMLTCYEVSTAVGDLEAMRFLQIAHESLQARASLLESSDHAVFLSNVPTNRAIAAAWGALQAS